MNASPDPTRADQAQPPKSQRPRHGILLLTCLLLLTLGGGLAARQMTEPAVTSATSAAATTSVSGPVQLSGRLDRGSVLQGSDGRVKLELVLRADDEDTQGVRVPTDLIVVFDRSGSMQGEPLAQAIASVRELIAGLAPDDRFALVTYSQGAELALPLQAASPIAVQGWQATLGSLQARGGTNMAAGLDLAAQVANERPIGRSVRVLLLSDGHANQGDHSLAGLRARAASAVASEYVLSAVGIGEGFDEHLMSTLADAGTGNFYYVRSGQELGGAFAGEFAAARETLATGLKVVVAEANGARLVEAAGYPLTRENGQVTFRPGSLFAGQERRIWLSWQVPTRDPAEARALGSVQLEFVHEGGSHELALPGPLQVACVEDETRFFASVDREAWAKSVTVDDYNALRNRVSEMVREGQQEPARQMIVDYAAEKEEMNQILKSPAVAEQLDSLDELRRDVDEAFAASPAQVNRLGKKLKADAIDGRRVGAKK